MPAIVIILCLAVGEVLGNAGGGFIVGVILAIVLGKQYWNAEGKKPA